MISFEFEHAMMGAAGFGAYEAFRIYKKTSAGQPVYGLEQGDRLIHLSAVLVLCLCSGLLAGYWGGISMIQALYLGASFPMSISTLVGDAKPRVQQRRRGKGSGESEPKAETVDDLSDAKPKGLKLLLDRFRDYF